MRSDFLWRMTQDGCERVVVAVFSSFIRLHFSFASECMKYARAADVFTLITNLNYLICSAVEPKSWTQKGGQNNDQRNNNTYAQDTC